MKGGAPVPGLAADSAGKRTPRRSPFCSLLGIVACSRVCVMLLLQNSGECVSMGDGAAEEVAARMRCLIGLVDALGLLLPSLAAQAHSGFVFFGGVFLF